MNAYVFQAALLCESCAKDTQTKLDRIAVDYGNATFAYREDSDKYPQGPFSDGGGEADSPQHCDHCGVFLENPLTGDGLDYVREKVREKLNPDDVGFDSQFTRDRFLIEAEKLTERGDSGAAHSFEVLALWLQFYGDQLDAE